MMITFINDQFPAATGSWYSKENINLPQLDQPYTIRRVYKAKDGTYLLLLNEVENRSFNGVEPGFPYWRFTDQPDNVLDWEVVQQLFLKYLES